MQVKSRNVNGYKNNNAPTNHSAGLYPVYLAHPVTNSDSSAQNLANYADGIPLAPLT